MRLNGAGTLCFGLTILLLCAFSAEAGTYLYSKKPISRDQILEHAHLYYDIHWRCDAENAYGTSITGARCPYGTTSGWKDALPYCWGGDDEIYQYLLKMTQGKGAGDRDTSSSSPYSSGQVGSVDCSGYVSQCYRSGRYATSSFYNVTTELASWDILAPGDATNDAGSHIRLCEKYPTGTGQILVYESTSGGGLLWCVTHRLLSYDNAYAPIRYNYVTAMPSLIDARVDQSGNATLRWLGAASTGFRVEQSTDGSAWTRVRDTAQLGPDADEVVISGLASNQIYYFRVRSVNGTTETGPSRVLPVRRADSSAPRVLLVDGFDRWLRDNSGSSFNAFLVSYAKALESSGAGLDSCDNLQVTRREAVLGDYAIVIWMAGLDGSGDYSLNFREMMALRDYLRAGGRLFISGSEIGWDLVDEAVAYDNLEVADTDFYSTFLKAQYIQDAAGSNRTLGAANSIFSGLTVEFDNGGGGVYNVQYPDLIQAAQVSQACLIYANSAGAAGIQYAGVFSGGTEEGKLVYLAFPFETIISETVRLETMQRVMTYFLPGNATFQIY